MKPTSAPRGIRCAAARTRERTDSNGAYAREGIILVVALLGIMALEAVAAGALLVAGRQLRVAHVAARTLHLQLAAQDGIALALAGWQPDSAAALAQDSRRALPADPLRHDISRRLTLRRVHESLFVLRSEAFSARGEHVGITALVRTAAPADYLADLPAAAFVGGALAGSGGVISGQPLESCGDTVAATAAPALAWPGEHAPATLHVLEGGVLTGISREASFIHAGVALPGLALAREAGSVTPVPVDAGGVCLDAAPDNWGAPADPGHPCAHRYPVLHVRGNLRIDGGAGQGVLLVDGDVELAPGSRYAGLLLVRGRAVLLGDALLEGAVHTGGDLVLEGGLIRREPCVIARVVLGAAGLRGPFRAIDHWWLPL